MSKTDIFFHSPLSPSSVHEEKNHALLLQFILSEIFHAFNAIQENSFDVVCSSPSFFFPYDLSYEIGHLNKIQEHILLLDQAFPHHLETIHRFRVTLQKTIALAMQKQDLLFELRELYRLLHPLIFFCKENENLLFFLLKHQKDIAELDHPENLNDLLLTLFPEGLETVQKLVCDNYQRRGFISLVAEIKQLISELYKDLPMK
jgi:hypothetical protein